MMSDKQLEEFIREVQDAITDAQDHFNAPRIEILSTLLAIALGGIRAEAKASGDLEEVEKDLESVGIIMQEVEDRYFNEEYNEEDISLDDIKKRTIH